MSRKGGDLALLMLAGFRTLADAATTELARRGYVDVRPVHDFALHSILSGAENASELGRALSVTKQAAARTIAVLEERGYVARQADETDRRKMRLIVTERGASLLREGEAVFDEMRDRLMKQVGTEQVATLEETLRALVGDNAIRLDAPGWAAAETADPSSTPS
jgi:DNA-binding MarR family transcriptional regulator